MLQELLKFISEVTFSHIIHNITYIESFFYICKIYVKGFTSVIGFCDFEGWPIPNL